MVMRSVRGRDSRPPTHGTRNRVHCAVHHESISTRVNKSANARLKSARVWSAKGAGSSSAPEHSHDSEHSGVDASQAPTLSPAERSRQHPTRAQRTPRESFAPGPPAVLFALPNVHGRTALLPAMPRRVPGNAVHAPDRLRTTAMRRRRRAYTRTLARTQSDLIRDARPARSGVRGAGRRAHQPPDVTVLRGIQCADRTSDWGTWRAARAAGGCRRGRSLAAAYVYARDGAARGCMVRAEWIGWLQDSGGRARLSKLTHVFPLSW
jgi:hypothetical protein